MTAELREFELTGLLCKLREDVNTLLDERDALRAELAAGREVVDRQAEDEGLWFVAETAAEAYLQQELRRLHSTVEGNAARAEGKT